MGTIKLTNDFHNTEVRVNARWQTDPDEGQGATYADICMAAMDGDESAKRVQRRISKALCGMDDCCCGVVR